MYLKLNQFEKSLVEELSTLSGYPASTVREILEFTFLRQVEQYSDSNEMSVPFIGKVRIVNKGDVFISGAKQADIDVFFAPSDLLKRIVGDVEDGESDLIENLLQKKFENALQVKLQEE
jgi:hypothetical protein